MSLQMTTAVCVVGAYLIGGIPFGFLAGRLRGIDVREAGSGNIGATNVGRLLGRRWGVAVFVLDVSKGLLPALAAGYLIDRGVFPDMFSDATRSLCWLLSGLSAVLGHNYSVYLGFRGGKGVSTSLGVALGVYPHLTIPALVAVLVWGIMVSITRIISVGSVAAGLAFPLAHTGALISQGESFSHHWPFVIFTYFVAGMVIVRHRANLTRIVRRSEPRLGRAGRPDDRPLDAGG